MTQSDRKHSFLERSLAVTLVAALVLTMPGASGWAAETPANSRNSRNSNSRPNIAVQPEGRSPNRSYVPLIPQNKRLTTAEQLAGALMNAASALAGFSRQTAVSGGISGLNTIASQMSHQVQVTNSPLIDSIQIGTPADSAIKGAIQALSPQPPATKDPSYGDGTAKLENEPGSLSALMTRLASKDDSAPGLQKIVASNFTGTGKMFGDWYTDLHVRLLRLDDEIDQTRGRLKGLTTALREKGNEMNLIRQRINGLRMSRSDTAEISIARLEGKFQGLQREQLTLARQFNEEQIKLNDSSEAKPGLLKKKQLLSKKIAQAKKFLGEDMGSLQVTGGKVPSLQTLEQEAGSKWANFQRAIRQRGQEGEQTFVEYLNEGVRKRRPGNEFTLIGGVLLDVARWAGRFQEKRTAAHRGIRELESLHMTDAAALSAADQKTKAFETFLIRSARGDYQEVELIRGLENGQAADYVRALAKAGRVIDTAVSRVKSIQDQLAKIKAGETGARDRLLRLAAEWEGKAFVDKYGALRSDHLGAILGQEQVREAGLFYDSRLGYREIKVKDEVVDRMAKDPFRRSLDLAQGRMQADVARALRLNLPYNTSTEANTDAYQRVLGSIWNSARSGDRQALALARRYDLPLFDSRTGKLFSEASQFNSLFAKTSEAADAPLTRDAELRRYTETFSNYERGWHTTYDFYHEKSVVVAAKTAWNSIVAKQEATRLDAFASAVTHGAPVPTGSAVGRFGERLWASAQAGIGMGFEQVMSPLHLYVGGAAKVLGSAMGEDSYYGSKLKFYGAITVGNNLLARAASGTTALTEVQATFGERGDYKYMPTFTPSGEVAFQTNHQGLNKELTSLWNYQQRSGIQVGQTGAELLSGVDLRVGFGVSAADGIREGSFGKVAFGTLGTAALVGTEVLAFGGINGVIGAGIKAAFGTRGALSVVGNTIRWGVVDLPALQFRISVAEGLGKGVESLASYQAGNIDQAAVNFGKFSTDVLGTLAGAGATAGARGALSRQGFLKPFGREVVKMATEGLLISAGGSLFGASGLVAATAGTAGRDLILHSTKRAESDRIARHDVGVIRQVMSGEISAPRVQAAAERALQTRMERMSPEALRQVAETQTIDLAPGGFLGRLGRVLSGKIWESTGEIYRVEGPLVAKAAELVYDAKTFNLGGSGIGPSRAIQPARNSASREIFRESLSELAKLRESADAAYEALQRDPGNEGLFKQYREAADLLSKGQSEAEVAASLNRLSKPLSPLESLFGSREFVERARQETVALQASHKVAQAHEAVVSARQAVIEKIQDPMAAGRGQVALRKAEADLVAARLGESNPETVRARELVQQTERDFQLADAKTREAKARAEIERHARVQERIDEIAAKIDLFEPVKGADPVAWKQAQERVKQEQAARLHQGLNIGRSLRDKVAKAAKLIQAKGAQHSQPPRSVARQAQEAQVRLELARAQERQAKLQQEMIGLSVKEASAKAGELKSVEREILAANARLEALMAELVAAKAEKVQTAAATQEQMPRLLLVRAEAVADLRQVEAQGSSGRTIAQAQQRVSRANRALELLNAQSAAVEATRQATEAQKAFTETRTAIEKLIKGSDPLPSDVQARVKASLLAAEAGAASKLLEIGEGSLTREIINQEVQRIEGVLRENASLAQKAVYETGLAVREFNSQGLARNPVAQMIHGARLMGGRIAAAIPLIASLGLSLAPVPATAGEIKPVEISLTQTAAARENTLSLSEAFHLAAARNGAVEAIAKQNKALLSRDFALLAKEAEAKTKKVEQLIYEALPVKMKEDFRGRFKEQAPAVKAALLGHSLGIQMSVGGGKTVIAVAVVGGRLAGKDSIAHVDLVVPNVLELRKFLNDRFGESNFSYAGLMEILGAKVYDMHGIVEGVKNGDPAKLAEFLNAMKDRKGVRIWTSESFGHLNTSSHDIKVDGLVREALRKASQDVDRLVLADEGDILLANPIQYILSQNSRSIGEAGLKYNEIYDIVSKTIGFDPATGKYITPEGGVLRAEDASTYESLRAEGKGKVYFVDPATDRVFISEAARDYFERQGVRQGPLHGEAERVLLGIEVRERYGYGEDSQTKNRVIAPKGAGGLIEANMVLSDALLATAIARANGSSALKALSEVRVSQTSMSSSGGRLFVGKSQVVLMSGSLEAVQSAAEAHGIPVQSFGVVKNVFRASSSADLMSQGVFGKGALITEQSVDALATRVAEQMMIGRSAERELFISGNEALRKAVAQKLIERGVKPEDIALFDHQITIEDHVTAIVKGKDVIRPDGRVLFKAPKFVIGAMDRAGRGVDYKGDINLIVDASGLRGSDVTQALGRVERGDPTQKFTRTLVGLEGNIRAVAEAAFSPSVKEALVAAGDVRHKIAVQNASDMKAKGFENVRDPVEPAGLDLLKRRNLAELTPEEIVQIGAWKLEMDASSRGMESNITSLIRDQYLEMPLMDKLRDYSRQPNSKEFKALQATIRRLFNNEYYVPQAMESTREAITGVERMRRTLRVTQEQAIKTLEDLQSQVRGTRLEADVAEMIADWKRVSIEGEGSRGSVAEADITVQEAFKRALSRGKELSPMSGGQRFTAAGIAASRMIRQAQESAARGTLSNAQALRVRDAAAQAILQSDGTGAHNSQWALLAGASGAQDVRRVLSDDAATATRNSSSLRAPFENFSARLSNAKFQFATQWELSRQAGLGTRIIHSAAQATKTAFGSGRLTPEMRVSLSARALAMGKVEAAATQNLMRWALLDPQAVAKALSLDAIDKLVAEATSSQGSEPAAAVRTLLAKLSGSAKSLNAIGTNASEDYSTRWSGKAGESKIVLTIQKPSAASALQAIALTELAHQAGLDIEIQLPLDASQSFRSGILKLTDNVSTPKTGLAQKVSGSLSSLRHPLQAVRSLRSTGIEANPISIFERAVAAVERAKGLNTDMVPGLSELGGSGSEQFAAILKGQAQRVESDLNAARVAARDIRQALELGLMNPSRVPENVRFLIGELANPANSTADARAAIEAYLDQSLQDQVGAEKGVVAVPESVSLVSSLQGTLQTAFKGQPEAALVNLSVTEAERAGERIRARSAERQEAYAALESDAARYHQNLSDLLAAQRSAESRARQAASQAILDEALQNNSHTVQQSVLALYSGSAQGQEKPAFLVASDTMDQHTFSALHQFFGDRLIRQLDYERYQAKHQQDLVDARRSAVESLIPSTEESAPEPKNEIVEAARGATLRLLKGSASAPKEVAAISLHEPTVLGLPKPIAMGIAAVLAAIALPVLTTHGFIPDAAALFSKPVSPDGVTIAQAGIGPVGVLLLFLRNGWRRGSDVVSGQMLPRARAVGEILRNA